MSPAAPGLFTSHFPRVRTVLSSLALVIGAVSAVYAQALAPRQPTLERASFHATALEGNALGDPAEQPVLIFLPRSYRAEPQRRYPVIYLLHGLGMKPSDWEVSWPGHPALSEQLNQANVSGGLPEMIVVYANGANAYMGSLYMNSSVEGRWEDAIVRDLVTWIDGRYRTLPQASSRAVIGLSMGGFGALRFGFLHPDIFSTVYALSPAFIGFAADFSEENPTNVSTPGAQSYEDLQQRVAQSRVRENYAGLFFICAAAFSPAPEEKPLPVKFPFVLRNGRVVRDLPVYQQWMANMPLTMVDEHLRDIRQLRAIGFDVGSNDHFRHIPITVRALDKALTERGVPHFFEEFNGGHTTHTTQRLMERAFPFAARNFLFLPEKK